MRSAVLRTVRWWAGPLLLAAVALAFDAADRRIPFGVWVVGPVDEVAHLSTAALGLLVLARFIAAPRRFYVAALIASVAIDVDHIPLYLGLLGDQAQRPVTHSLSTVAVFAAAAAASRRHRAVLAGVATGLVLHFARDVAEGYPGVRVFWPLQDTSWMVGYRWFLGMIVLFTAAWLVLVSAGLPRTRIPVFRAPSPRGSIPRVTEGQDAPGSGSGTDMDMEHSVQRVSTGPAASVVVCVYTDKRWPQIERALSSIAEQTARPGQVVVVVDHNPALCQRLAAQHPDLEVIPSKFERGLSGARNTGIEHAKGDVVVFLDDDACADPGWLQSLLACYDDESVLGAGGLVLPDWSPADRPGWLPGEFLWVVGCSYRGLPETKAEVRNPVGASMSFRRTAFERAGYFDSSVGRNVKVTRPMGCEETEFSIRLRQAWPDGRIVYEPRAVVYHHVDASRQTWHYFLNRCYAEGFSKAQVAKLSGMSPALSSERTYVIHAVRQALYREFSGLGHTGGKDALGRLAALLLGVSWTAAGFVWASASRTGFPSRGKRRARWSQPR